MLFSRGFAPDMAQLSDLKLKYRLLIQGYPFRRVDWRPGTRLEKPLKEARIALITTAGFYLPGQKAFDHSGIEADRNLALPLDRLRGLVEAGVVGEVAPRQFSTMGSLIAPARLISESGPEIARKLKEDAVDAVLLAPVCPFCHQAAGCCKALLRRPVSRSISLLLEITKRVEPPRVLGVDKSLGYPLGEPQKRVLLATQPAVVRGG